MESDTKRRKKLETNCWVLKPNSGKNAHCGTDWSGTLEEEKNGWKDVKESGPSYVPLVKKGVQG